MVWWTSIESQQQARLESQMPLKDTYRALLVQLVGCLDNSCPAPIPRPHMNVLPVIVVSEQVCIIAKFCSISFEMLNVAVENDCSCHECLPSSPTSLRTKHFSSIGTFGTLVTNSDQFVDTPLLELSMVNGSYTSFLKRTPKSPVYPSAR